jgi:hypothetical protein
MGAETGRQNAAVALQRERRREGPVAPGDAIASMSSPSR